MEKRLEQIEEAIVGGRIDEARSRLIAWDADARVKAAAARLRGAELARRSGLHSLALRLLHPRVRGSQRSPARPSPAEVVEYAGSLVQIGARSEAREMLEAVDPQSVPLRDLFLAFAHFAEWDYENALAPLRRFTEAGSVSDYQSRVGALNLAAALVATGRHEEARSRLRELLADAPSLLRANALEVQAQLEISCGDYSSAEISLEAARESSRHLSGTYDLLIEKWGAVLDLRRSRGSRASRGALAAVRARAFETQRWEVVRDCDFHLAEVTGDTEIAKKLYFGTPYACYRKRVVSFAGWLVTEGEYHWRPLGSSERVLDVATKATGKLDILLRSLCQDFYRPQRIGELFAVLYPGERFSPSDTASKMNQLIMRLRAGMKRTDLPLQLRIEAQAARLVFRGPVSVRVASDGGISKKIFAGLDSRRWYGNRDLRAQLGLSARTINRLVADALAEGGLLAKGSGKTKRYKLAE